jgi:hypothetical protein
MSTSKTLRTTNGYRFRPFDTKDPVQQLKEWCDASGYELKWHTSDFTKEGFQLWDAYPISKMAHYTSTLPTLTFSTVIVGDKEHCFPRRVGTEKNIPQAKKLAAMRYIKKEIDQNGLDKPEDGVDI